MEDISVVNLTSDKKMEDILVDNLNSDKVMEDITGITSEGITSKGINHDSIRRYQIMIAIAYQISVKLITIIIA